MKSKLTLMLVALLAMAGIATAQTPKEAKAARRASIGEGTELVKNNFVRLYKRNDYNFDIELFQNNAWIGTSYHNGGYATYIQFDGSEKKQLSGFINAETVVTETEENGIKVNLTAEVPSEDSKVVNIKYTVTNTTNETKKFKLGSCADTQLAGNDGAPISKNGNTITMKSGDYQYSIGVFSSTGVPLGNLWYGNYSGYTNHVFDNGCDPYYNQGNDSAIAWSWEITLTPGASDTFIAGGGSSVAIDSSDAIDLNVPAYLGKMDGTNGPTDLAAFLEEYQKIHVNPPYIKLTLEPGAKYVISKPLTTMSAITIVGDEKNPAIIDAEQLGSKPFVEIKDASEAVSAKPNDKGFYTSIYNVEFKNFIVEKAQGSLFSSNGQKYDIPYMTIDNVVYEAKNSGKPLISLLDGGIVENLTMTRSTAYTSGYLYNGTGSAKLAEAGVNSQKFTFSYNTLVGTYGLVHADDNESAKRTINVDHNVIMERVLMEQGANFVTGLNAGDANCIVQYNAFLSPLGTINANGDVVYNDFSNTEDANGAACSIKGNMVWVNIKKLFEDLWVESVVNFPMGDCPQRDAKIGDPRWLSAKMRVKESDVDAENDLAKVINEGVKKGYTEFELVQNQYGNLRYTVKQSIVTDKAISITGENVQIDVEHSDPFIQLSTTPAEAAVNDYFRIDQMLLKGLEIKGIKNSIIYDNNTKYCVVDLTIDDCVLGLETEAVKNEALISFQAGGVKDFTIKNSTVYGNNAVAKYFIRYNNSARLDRYGFDKNTEFQTMTYQNNTFYGLLKSDGQWGNYNGIAGQNYSKFVVEKNIWYNSSNEIIRRMAGGRFGSNAPQTFDKNTYFLNGADNSAKEAGYDKSGTALTTDPGFKDAANGDFTLSAYSAQCNEQTGDPRWFAEGGHYNPVTGIETVKTAEETSLENAVIYNLNGQRVEKAQKGINIVNGKKVIIK